MRGRVARVPHVGLADDDDAVRVVGLSPRESRVQPTNVGPVRAAISSGCAGFGWPG